MSLALDLIDWTDWDMAGFSLGKALGIFEADAWLSSKHIFWTNNALGSGLRDALDALVTAGITERREEPDVQYRWVTRNSSAIEGNTKP